MHSLGRPDILLRVTLIMFLKMVKQTYHNVWLILVHHGVAYGSCSGPEDQGVELRSPVPGQIPVCDLLGPTTGSYKTLPASPRGKKLPPTPQPTWWQTGAL